jgi:hypothetical protein
VGTAGQEVLAVLVLVEPMFLEDCNGAKALQIPLLPTMVDRNRKSRILERLMLHGVVFVLMDVYVSMVGKDSAVVIVMLYGRDEEIISRESRDPRYHEK